MKRTFAVIMCLCMALSMIACTDVSMDETVPADVQHRNFMSQWANYQHYEAINARVETDSFGNRILKADIKNTGLGEISRVVLSFAIWDADGNFIVIKSKSDPNNTQAEYQKELRNVRVAKDSIWVANNGVSLDPSCPEIKYVEAALVSCVADGADYKNELYEGWKDAYLDKPLTEDMRAVNAEFDPKQKLAKLREDLKSEPLYISASEVYINSTAEEVYLLANVMNASESTVTGFKLSFAAWDSDGRAVSMIRESEEFESNFIKSGTLGDISINPGKEWVGCADEEGNITGVPLAFEHSNIDYVEAIVVSYTTEDGQVHENPYYSEWESYFRGVILENWMREKQ